MQPPVKFRNYIFYGTLFIDNDVNMMYHINYIARGRGDAYRDVIARDDNKEDARKFEEGELMKLPFFFLV